MGACHKKYYTINKFSFFFSCQYKKLSTHQIMHFFSCFQFVILVFFVVFFSTKPCEWGNKRLFQNSSHQPVFFYSFLLDRVCSNKLFVLPRYVTLLFIVLELTIFNKVYKFRHIHEMWHDISQYFKKERDFLKQCKLWVFITFKSLAVLHITISTLNHYTIII